MNAALVAKQILSLDALAGGGRAVLGIAIGGREDDYEVSGAPMADRGAWLDAGLDQIRHIWNGDGEHESRIGPRPTGSGPSLIVGGSVDASFERAARHADGWIMGGGSPDDFAGAVEKLDAAWEKEGREGAPRKMALAYFSLGPDAAANAERYLPDYYAFLGEELSGMIAASAAKDADTVQGYLSAFESAGCDELVLFPCSSDPEQVSLLAEAAGL
jgi:alkanesulfonate monooxygenase SsuD/methylene tetrahydromethanopterin reductase-like flavin-dependent oxidoreductase (luciferase family)